MLRWTLETMIAGAVSAAYVGTALVHRVSERLLERVILVFLVVIGPALIVEAFLTQDVPGLLADPFLVRIVAAAIFGLAVGLVSGLLGVAGGELIIPTLVFAFGAGIKTAGTASLLWGCFATVGSAPSLIAPTSRRRSPRWGWDR